MKSCIKTVYVISENLSFVVIVRKIDVRTHGNDNIKNRVIRFLSFFCRRFKSTTDKRRGQNLTHHRSEALCILFLRRTCPCGLRLRPCQKKADQTIFNVGVSFCANFCMDFLEIRTKGNTLTLKIV